MLVFPLSFRSSCLGGARAAPCAPCMTEVGVVRSPRLAFPCECQQTWLWGRELEPVLWQVIDTSTAENGLRGVPMLPIETDQPETQMHKTASFSVIKSLWCLRLSVHCLPTDDSLSVTCTEVI